MMFSNHTPTIKTHGRTISLCVIEKNSFHDEGDIGDVPWDKTQEDLSFVINHGKEPFDELVLADSESEEDPFDSTFEAMEAERLLLLEELESEENKMPIPEKKQKHKLLIFKNKNNKIGAACFTC